VVSRKLLNISMKISNHGVSLDNFGGGREFLFGIVVVKNFTIGCQRIKGKVYQTMRKNLIPKY